MKTLFYQ